ncbi:MAG TPA: hypothetical protein DCG75_10755 [Bacteroidales bacterium]|nr:hypothetical protein [Bacteroidales bacterium]
MNSFKTHFNSLAFKIIVVLSVCAVSNLTKLSAQQMPDTNYIKILYDSTKVFYANGDYNNAIDDLNKIILLKRKIPNDINPEYFKVFNRMGLVYKQKGDLHKAIDFYKKALENTSDKYILSLINDNVANVYSLTGDYLKAIFYYESTLSILEKSEDKDKYRRIANNYHNQGYAYYKLEKYDIAEKNYLQSIQIAEENQLDGIGETYYNCGLVYSKLNKLKDADYYFKKAIDSYVNDFGESHYMTAMAYMNYAVFYSKTKEYLKAEKLFGKANNIFYNTFGYRHPYTSYCLMHMGNLYYQTKNYKQALDYYQKSLISKINSFDDSLIYRNPSPKVFPDLDLLDILKAKAQAFEKLAEHEDKGKNLKAALSTLELAVGFIDQLRTSYIYESSKLQLAAKEHETYLLIIGISNSLYEISGNIKYAEIEFKYAELSKYAVLRELKNEEMSRGIAGVPDSISDNERNIKEQISGLRMQIEEESKLANPNNFKISSWNEELFGLTQKLEKLIEEVEENYPVYYKQKYSNKVVSVEQLQKEMDKKEAILEYVLGDSALYTFIITQDTFLLLKQDADSAFYTNLDFYKTVLHQDHSSNYYDYRDAAYKLYKKLIYPFEHLLQNKNLLIIPDDELQQISFDALIDKPYKESDIPDYRKESYLIRKYAISYSYSATLYTNSLKQEYRGAPKFLGIAPDYKNSKDSLRYLPLGLKQVRRLSLLTFGKSLTGNRATKNRFKKYGNQYDIIHFYAHGFEDTLNPANSKLVLSLTDTTDDGSLYAWEVSNMQLNARLVILASCYSGSGKLSKGEGVLSIGRSFINADSKTVIMSLWLASYEPSIKISKYFYGNLFKGMRKDEALRLAKLKYIEESISYTAPPRFWAGLVIIGNNTPLYHNYFLKRAVFLSCFIILIIVILKTRKRLTKFF